jgi:uncharacterized membrane protein (DUF4010 family)
MLELQNFKLMGIALAIGLLIGLERGWHTRDKDEGMRIAGLRTYGLIAVLGGLWGIIAKETGVLLIGFAFMSLSLILLVAYFKSLKKFEDYSITSVIATLITFTLGALTSFGHIELAPATAVVITLLLGYKPLLHSWVHKLEQQELEATLKLLLISVVILPILPDQPYGPWGVINPYTVWLLVVLIAGISFVGYFAIKIVGYRHGPVLTGFFGGIVSSSVLTINLSRLSKNHPVMQNALSAGILTSCGTMFIRVLLLTLILNQALSKLLMLPLIIMGSLTYLSAYLYWRYAEEFHQSEEIKLANPFQIGMAIKFGFFLVSILLLSKGLQSYFGDLGTYVLAATSGLADVDPITLSLAKMSNDGLSLDVAERAILIAVAVNSFSKSLIAAFIGDRKLGLKVGTALAFAVIVGLGVA